MSEIPSWVAVGTELMEVRTHFSSTTYGPRRKIAKVYKNGNFIVEGSPDQWRPNSFNDTAWRTGSSRYSSGSLYRITPHLIAEMEAATQVATARARVAAEIKRLEQAMRDDDAVVAAAAALPAPPTLAERERK